MKHLAIFLVLFYIYRTNCLYIETRESLSNFDNQTVIESNQTETKDETFKDFLLVEDPSNEEHVVSKRSINSVNTIYPEILVVVDKTLFNKLGNSKTKAREYVVNFMSAVNLRFKSVESPRIQLKLADIHLSQSKYDTPYITNNILSSNSFDAATALSEAGKYFYGKTYPGVDYDIVLILTGEEMCRYKGSGSKCHPSTAGYAYVGGACKSSSHNQQTSSVGIVEDNGGYSGVIVTAHELAHLLGASHDGDSSPSYVGGPGARSCSPSHGYIMSDNRRTIKGLQWSSCSLNQFNHYLTSSSASCMYNIPMKENYPLLTHNQLTARVPSADEQCQMEAGTNACFHDENMCTQLFCYSQSGGCISYRPAVEGTACAGKGFCSNGLCVKPSTYYTKLIPSISSRSSTIETVKSTPIYSTTTPLKTTVTTTRIISRSPWTTTTQSMTSSSLPSRVTTTSIISSSPWTTTTNSQTSSTTPLRTSTSPLRSSTTYQRLTNDVCTDSEGPVGHGLSCGQLFTRYPFLYCKNSTMKTKCCQSFNKHC